jgi:hypothetical protein
MSMLKKSLMVLIAILLALVIIGFMLPSHYKVERSIIINASQQDIFPHVANLKKWQNWGLWFKHHPNMTITYSGQVGRVGMKSLWVSSTRESGEIEIIGLEKNHRLVYSLNLSDTQMSSTGEIVLSKVEGGTKVVWMDYGDVGINPINRYFAFFMDYLIGSDFELGLDNLKLVAEAS